MISEYKYSPTLSFFSVISLTSSERYLDISFPQYEMTVFIQPAVAQNEKRISNPSSSLVLYAK
jgi:hypothetical protein